MEQQHLDINRQPFIPASPQESDDQPALSADAAGVRARNTYRPDEKIELTAALGRAERALLALQQEEGCWSFELEADCTIPAEYILMMHFMDEIDTDLQAKLANYIRNRQSASDGWPLYTDGGFDMSCSVKAYYALKLAGDSPDDAHMVRARNAILKHGGAARSNVFTRITLALFQQVPWRATPFIPAEIMLLPRWFPFHISKVSYWSRTVMIPLLILCTLKPQARNPRNISISELFSVPADEERHYFRIDSTLNRLFLLLDRGAKLLEPLIPRGVRQHAIQKAEQWFTERLNGTGGLGAIFPAMVNAHEALACLGYSADHPYRRAARQALEELLVVEDNDAYCQPCNSPVWDTALATLALQECGNSFTETDKALDWLQGKQLTDEPGDWREHCPDSAGGGWAFQYENSYYPDLDDTAVAAWAMHAQDHEKYQPAIQLATDWICCMQSRNGGFAAFDVDNTCYYLNAIPFADHGALLDPPTADVSARCATLLALQQDAGNRGYEQALKHCLTYLQDVQESDGSWFGRWGTNYIYGTWSVLVALEQAGISPDETAVVRAANWLKSKQHDDGGWGEHNDSYEDSRLAGGGYKSTAFQTAWAMLALLAAGEGNAPQLYRGAQYLLNTQGNDGLWHDNCFTAPGFPRVFYLRYHGYDKYFPLWALARYYHHRFKRTG